MHNTRATYLSAEPAQRTWISECDSTTCALVTMQRHAGAAAAHHLLHHRLVTDITVQQLQVIVRTWMVRHAALGPHAPVRSVGEPGFLAEIERAHGVARVEERGDHRPPDEARRAEQRNHWLWRLHGHRREAQWQILVAS